MMGAFTLSECKNETFPPDLQPLSVNATSDFQLKHFFDFAIMGSQSQSPHVDLNDALAEKPLCKITQANSQ